MYLDLDCYVIDYDNRFIYYTYIGIYIGLVKKFNLKTTSHVPYPSALFCIAPFYLSTAYLQRKDIELIEYLLTVFELRKSLRKLSSTSSKSVSELANKIHIFTTEVERLNKRLPEIGNNYIMENNLGAEAVEQIKKINAITLEDFIKLANVPGTNTQIKIKV